MAKGRRRTDSASATDNPGHLPEDTALEGPSGLDGGASLDHRDRVAMRAYELYLARGGADGGDFDDWLAAEREIAGGNGGPSRGDAGE